MDILSTFAKPVVVADKEELFTQLVNRHLDEIYNFSKHMVSDSEEANDISQKTFLSLYRNLHKLNFSTSPRPWLFKVARNFCLDYIKKKKPIQFSENEAEILEIPESLPSVEAMLDEEIFLQQFKSNLDNLPVTEKEILLLKYFEDLTFEQIAEIQNIPLNTVKSHFYRAKTRLFKILNK